MLVFESLKVFNGAERYKDFLLQDEFLHQFGLLEASRLVTPQEISSSVRAIIDDPSTLQAKDGKVEGIPPKKAIVTEGTSR